MTQDKRTKLSNILVIIGLILMIVTAVTPLLPNHNINMELMRWVFTTGALIVLVARLIGFYRGSSLRIKRLHVILIFSALLFCASAAMFQDTNNWIAFLMAGLVVQLYASWMIDRESNKGEK